MIFWRKIVIFHTKYPKIFVPPSVFGVFRVKNHDFTPINHIFFNCGGRHENFGVFRVKNHDFTPKNHIFSKCEGRREIFIGVKSLFFTQNTPKMFTPPSAIGKNKIFWRKIVIFHTKYPKNFRAFLRSAQIFLSAPPLT
jgi:hypothetical protein